MKALRQWLHARRDGAVLVACLIAALVAVQINDDRADGRTAVEVARK